MSEELKARLRSIGMGELKQDKRRLLGSRLRSRNFCMACVYILKKIVVEGVEGIFSRDLMTAFLLSRQQSLNILNDLVSMGFLRRGELSKKLLIFRPARNDGHFILTDYEDIIMDMFEWHRARET